MFGTIRTLWYISSDPAVAAKYRIAYAYKPATSVTSSSHRYCAPNGFAFRSIVDVIKHRFCPR